MASFGERRSPSGRFLPPDPRVTEPYRLTPQLVLRVGMLGALALAVFAILFLRLWALQVLSGDRYLVAAQDNQVRTLRVEAPRGTILDRNGVPLVTNVAGTAVYLWPADMPKEGRYRMVKRLAEILRVEGGVPAIAREIEERKGDPVTPVLLKTAVHPEQVMYLKEHKAEFPGVEVGDTLLRNYERKALGAQILGHVREISEDELEAKQKAGVEGYRAGDKIGKSGIEASFDEFLRGIPGQAHIRVDSLGRPLSGVEPELFPTPGHSVRLTLDARLQRSAEQALQFGIDTAFDNENWYANGGAVVALDPTDGAVLAMASNPTYKPSIYVGRLDPKKLEDLYKPEANTPLLNRAVAGRYPPGSTWKPVTALAAMLEGLLSPYQAIQCSPYREFGLDRQRFKNWNPYVNEPMTLPTALAASCDTYFYDVGNRFYELPESRGQPLQRWARDAFGFGQTSIRDLGGEDPGLLPTIPWKREHFAADVDKLWKPGDSVQLAIGQGDLVVTPLQMARFYALLANGGKLVTPYLVSNVEQPGNEGRPPVVRQSFPPTPPKQAVPKEALTPIDEGLRAATSLSYGTSVGVFGSFPVPIRGKTGTAEKWSNEHERLLDQSWWCGYGPPWNDRSPIALCIVIENGGFGGEAAAPAALKILETHYGVKAPVVTEALSD